MAKYASNSSLRLKAVSADKAPTTLKPSFFRVSIAGWIISISSVPIFPPSPAWGLSPRTAILGEFILNLFLSSLSSSFIFEIRFSFLIVLGTSFRGIWVVASATFNSSHISIIM